MSNDLVFWVVAILLGLLGLMLLVLTKYAISYLHQRIDLVQDAKTKAMLDNLVTLAGQKVLMIEQTIIADLKHAVMDGKITKGDLPGLLAAAKSTAVDAVKRDAGSLGVWDEAIKSMGGADNLLKWLSDVIESQVAQTPPSGLKQIAKSADPAPAKTDG